MQRNGGCFATRGIRCFCMKALASGCVDGVPARTDTQTFARQDGMSKKAGEAGLRIPSAIAGVPKARSNRLSFVVACGHIFGKRLRGWRACTHRHTDICQAGRNEQEGR